MSKTRLFSKEDGTTFFEDIKAFFAGIPPYILSLLNQLQDLAEPIVEQAVEIGNVIKGLIQEDTWSGNIIESIVESTKTPIDDAVLEWLRENWGGVLAELSDLPELIADITEATEDYFDSLADLPEPLQNAMLNKTVSVIARKYSNEVLGKNLSESDADYMVQAYYVDKKSFLS